MKFPLVHRRCARRAFDYAARDSLFAHLGLISDTGIWGADPRMPLPSTHMFGRRKKCARPIPPEVIAEARAYPNGSVAEIATG